MSNGVIIFANNNQQIDYVKQAVFCAQRVKDFMGVETCLITENKSYYDQNFSDRNLFDYIVGIDKQQHVHNKKFRDGLYSEKTLPWKNHARINAYDLSPFDKTLVIDSDFIVSNDILNNCFTSNHNFLISKKFTDLKSSRQLQTLDTINDKSIDMYWATVFYFTKNQSNKILFDLISHIKHNYDFYRLKYKIVETKYRNDFAFSIAIHIMNGFQQSNWPATIPSKLWTTFDKDILVDITNEKMTFLLEHGSDYIASTIKNANVHIMNKFSLNRIIDEQNV